MLRVSKRCRLLVSLLLLCGCFLSCFSGSAFAYSAGTDGDIQHWIYSADDTVSFRVRGVLGDNVMISSNSHDVNGSAYTQAQYETTLFLTFWIRNQNDFNVYTDFSYLDVTPGFTRKDSGAPYDINFKGIDMISGEDWFFSAYDSGEVTFRPTGGYAYNNFFAIPAKTSLVCEVAITYSWTLSSASTFILPDGFYLSSLDINVNDFEYNTISDDSWNNPSASIENALQNQTQQQQQQHEEQLEQNQQQYDDFTNDGNSPSSDGISGSDFVGSSRDEVNDKLGFFEIINYTIQGVLGIFNADAVLTDTTLTLPGFEIPIRSTDPNTGMVTSTTYTVWRDTEYDLGAELNTNFGGLMTVVRFATSVVVLFSLINYIIKVYHRILDIPRW